MSLKGHRDAINQHVRVAFGNLAILVAAQGANTTVALARHRDAHHFADRRSRYNAASVTGWIIQTNYAAHVGGLAIKIMFVRSYCE